VTEEPRDTAAVYSLRDTEEVRELLERLAREGAARGRKAQRGGAAAGAQ
jgi:hypothetical protein